MLRVETILNSVEANKKGAYANWVDLVNSEKKVAVEKRTIPPFIQIVFEEIQKKAKDVRPHLLSNVWQDYSGRKLLRDLNWTGSEEFKKYFDKVCRAVPRLGDYWELSNCGFDSLKALYAKGQLLPNIPRGVKTEGMASSKLLTWAVNKIQEKIQGGELESKKDKTVLNWILSLPGIDVNVDGLAFKVLRARKYQLFSSLVSHPRFSVRQTWEENFGGGLKVVNVFEEALPTGDISAVKILLKNKKADVHAANKNKVTPLMIAVTARKTEMVNLLLPMLTLDDLTLKGSTRQETALALATLLKASDIIKAITERMTELTTQQKKLLTALKNGKLADLKQDLEAGKLLVDMHVLHEAAKSANANDMNLLLIGRWKTRVPTFSELGHLIVTASIHKNEVSKQCLLSSMRGRDEAHKLRVLLLHACRANDVTLVQDLRDAGAGYKPLLIRSAEKGDVGMLTALLRDGDSIPDLAVVQAAKEGQLAAVEWLLAKGANSSAVGNNRFSALCLAAHYKNLEVVKALVAHKANVGINEIVKAFYRGADMLRAVLSGNTRVVVADVVMPKSKMPLLKVAVKKGNVDLVKLLVEHKAKVTEAVILAAYSESPEMLDAVLAGDTQKLASKRTIGDEKTPLLHHAINADKLQKVVILVKHKVGLDLVYKDETPFQVATRLKSQGMIALLQSPAPKPEKKAKDPVDEKKAKDPIDEKNKPSGNGGDSGGFPGWIIPMVGVTLVASLAMLYLYQKGYLTPKALPKVA